MNKGLVILPAINLAIALIFVVIGTQQPDVISYFFYVFAVLVALPAMISLSRHKTMLKIARFFLFTSALFGAMFAIFSLAGFLNVTRVPGASLTGTFLYVILCVYLLGFKGYINVYEESLEASEAQKETV